MKSFLGMAILVVLVSLVTLSAFYERNPGRNIAKRTTSVVDNLVSPQKVMDLRSPEFSVLLARARNGDKIAIGDIIEQYWIDYRSPKDALLWTEKLGDSGDKQAQLSLIEYYETGSDPIGKEQASRLRRKWGIPPR